MLATAALALVGSGSAMAASLLTGSDGTYGQVAMARNDDGFTSVQTLPFEVDFYGQVFDHFFINNNGNITFSAGMGSYTPFNLGNLTQAMIAPYWADVDTRNPASGQVYVGSFAPGQVNITWDNVGYYSQHADKLNSFQLNLYKVGNSGDFDIEFRYDQLQWTTGDASQGVNGLGGVPAVAGYTNGAGISYLQPGSFLSPGALNMAVESNTDPEEAGRWVYNIRNDTPPPVTGASPDAPILPTASTPDNGYSFTFNVSEDRVYYIDPPVATGYDYAVAGGLQFTSVVFTTLLNDPNGYDLYDSNGNLLVSGLLANQTYNFATALSSFSVRGINPAAGLQPGDPNAFVSGFTFNGFGTPTVTQTPFVEDITVAVPEPGSWAMMIAGIGVIGGIRRASSRRNRSIVAA